MISLVKEQEKLLDSKIDYGFGVESRKTPFQKEMTLKWGGLLV